MTEETTDAAPPKQRRGFACMTPEKRKELASRGGKAVPAGKRSFAQNRELASEAGKRGGMAVPASKRTYSLNRELASTSGRKGGMGSRPSDG